MKKIAVLIAVLALPLVAVAATGSGEEANNTTPSAADTVSVTPESGTLFSRVKRQYRKWSGFMVGMKAVSPMEHAELGRIDAGEETAEADSVNKSDTVKQ